MKNIKPLLNIWPIQVLVKWHGRSAMEKRLLAEAFFLLAVVRLALLFLPFRWIAPTLGRHMAQADIFIKAEHLRKAKMIGRAVRSAANHTPWESVCLPQAITAKWMTKYRGIPGTIYLGVTKNETLSAHAWLQCGPVIITGANGIGQYTVVSTFS